jgi:hypothetical protein
VKKRKKPLRKAITKESHLRKAIKWNEIRTSAKQKKPVLGGTEETNPAKVKRRRRRQDDDILKHYTKEERDKERSVDNELKNLVRRKEESLKSWKSAQGEKTILEECWLKDQDQQRIINNHPPHQIRNSCNYTHGWETQKSFIRSRSLWRTGL